MIPDEFKKLFFRLEYQRTDNHIQPILRNLSPTFIIDFSYVDEKWKMVEDKRFFMNG